VSTQETQGIECFVLQPVTKLRTEDSCRGESSLDCATPQAGRSGRPLGRSQHSRDSQTGQAAAVSDWLAAVSGSAIRIAVPRPTQTCAKWQVGNNTISCTVPVFHGNDVIPFPGTRERKMTGIPGARETGARESTPYLHM